MSFISDLFTGLLVGYIAFTNSLATGITNTISPEPASEEIELALKEPVPEDLEGSFLNQLPSRLSAIPDILLKSAAYQQAAVGDAVGLSGSTATDTLDALVNIFCTFRSDTQIRTTTGTGFFIDPDGVIMTNAHVAQFLLMAETDEYGTAECTVRTGNPAAPQYTASLLYIPPAWVQDNAAALRAEIPMGTGERDYALLFVDNTVDQSPLPAVFPALSYSTELLSTRTRGSDVVALSELREPLADQSSTRTATLSVSSSLVVMTPQTAQAACGPSPSHTSNERSRKKLGLVWMVTLTATLRCAHRYLVKH